MHFSQLEAEVGNEARGSWFTDREVEFLSGSSEILRKTQVAAGVAFFLL